MKLTTADILQAWAELEVLEEQLALCDDPTVRGVIEETIAGQLAGLAQDGPAKMDALRAVAIRSRAEQDTLRDEERRFAARRKSSARVEARCRASIEALLVAGGPVRTASGSYRMQLGPEKVAGPESIEDWYAHGWVRESVAADKVAALRDLKAMEPDERPAGFSLLRGRSLRW